MASLSSGMHQLTREELQLANFLERAKHNLKEEGVVLKNRINGTIMWLVTNLLVFFASHFYGFRMIVIDGETSHTFAFGVASVCWVAISCLVTYLMIDSEIGEMDKLLQRDKVLNKNIDVFIRNIRNSFEMYRVSGEFIGGPAAALDIKVFPYIVDHGVCVSKLAVLKKLVEEPMVALNYRFIYRLLVLTLSSCEILFIIGFAVISDYAMKGDELLESEYLNFGLLSPT